MTRAGHVSEGAVPGPFAAWWARATSAPAYAPAAGDRRDIRVLGLELPLRASVVVLAATALIVVDELRYLLPPAVPGAPPPVGTAGLPLISLERFLLYGIVPLAIVLLAFRDDPRRYGIQLGEWRWGVAFVLPALAVMTVVIFGLAQLPDFRRFYGVAHGTPAQLVVATALEVSAAEFMLRGFVLFPLLRRVGPIAIVLVQVPFVLTHVGKPELELWSTFLGGFAFAWLDWRTRSILWSAIAHTWILSLMVIAVGGTTG